MSKPDFSKMSPEEFDTYQAKQKEEAAYRQWCMHTSHDPEDDVARDTYKEIQDEYGPSYWDDLDPNDRKGTEHNIIKDIEG